MHIVYKAFGKLHVLEAVIISVHQFYIVIQYVSED